MANDHLVLYTGVTSNLIKRVYEHKYNLHPKSFTAKYRVHKLIYYEVLDSIETAIIREKQIKNMNRDQKLKMIYQFNQKYLDLYDKINT